MRRIQPMIWPFTTAAASRVISAAPRGRGTIAFDGERSCDPADPRDRFDASPRQARAIAWATLRRDIAAVLVGLRRRRSSRRHAHLAPIWNGPTRRRSGLDLFRNRAGVGAHMPGPTRALCRPKKRRLWSVP
jgi:hypothetical protein